LLAQIKAERENRYQQQLAEWETAVKEREAIGKVGKKPTKPQKFKELPSLNESELAELPKLPNGWCWVRYGSICLEIRNGISQKPDSDHGEKIFRISAVRPFFIDLQDFRYIDNSDHRYEDFLLENNEVLFTRYNGSRRYVGVCAKFNSNERFLYPDKLIKTRLFSCELTLPDYIVYAANVGGSREYLDKRIRTTAGQSGVSGEDIKLTPVPICSIKEQEQIIQEIESRLSICDQLEATVIENLQKAEALRQSILKQAFEGKLVPQDPNDEPAEKLLEKIRIEKAQIKFPFEKRVTLRL
jgi:type I restriction enzyme S subunit